MNDHIVRVWGIWSEREKDWKYRGAPWWSFDRDLMERMKGPIGEEVRAMSEYDIAKIPEAATAVTALLNMRAARLRVLAAEKEVSRET